MYVHVCHECISYMYMYSRCYLRIFFYIPVYYILSATVIIYPACTNLLWSLLNFLFTNKCNFLFLESQGDQSTQKWGGFTCSSLTCGWPRTQKWLLLIYKADLKNSAAFSCPRNTSACSVESWTGHQSTWSMDNWFPIRMWNTDLIGALTNSYLRTPFVMWYMWTSQQWRCVLQEDFFSTGMDPTWIDYQLRHPNQSTHIKLMCGAAYRAEEEQVSVYFLE